MKNIFTAGLILAWTIASAQAQVSRINSNGNLRFIAPLADKALFTTINDGSIWVSDGTPASTVALSTDLQFVSEGILLGDKFVFQGCTATSGNELYITDGTPGGTHMIAKLSPLYGANPRDFTLMDGIVYFTASIEGIGRELWRTDGTSEGTWLVKDICPGEGNSMQLLNTEMKAIDNKLFFSAFTPEAGLELWVSDGTGQGTQMVQDIAPGPNSSYPSGLWVYQNLVLFTANDGTNGIEYWRSDGTPSGTFMLKNIKEGRGSATQVGYHRSFEIYFHLFDGRAYFMANDSINTCLYATDGTQEGTRLVNTLFADQGHNESYPENALTDALNLQGKFIFFVHTDAGLPEYQLWQSDGTSAGTTVISPDFIPSGYKPHIFLNRDPATGQANNTLIKGNKFFFFAEPEGPPKDECYSTLWISDGTHSGTQMLKTLYGFEFQWTDKDYILTKERIFFEAFDNRFGSELWTSDGTAEGTRLFADISPAGSSCPTNFALHNGVVYFSANDGDDVSADLYAINGLFAPLPGYFGEFTLTRTGNNALLKWKMLQPDPGGYFDVQRSVDGKLFDNIGRVYAMPSATTPAGYEFADTKFSLTNGKYIYYRVAYYSQSTNQKLTNVLMLAKALPALDVKVLSNTPGANPRIWIASQNTRVSVRVTDMSGRTVYSNMVNAGSQPVEITMPVLTTGIYIVTVSNGNEQQSLRLVW